VLLGGETAEMPGFYADGEYDVAGFIVGVVDGERVIDGRAIAPGDIVLGVPSVGLHTNGYSLARKLFFEVAGHEADTYLDELGETVGAALLRPHVSYLRPLEGLLDQGIIKGLAHITGGGLLENIPRILPSGTSIELKRNSWPVLPVFQAMRRLGNIDDAEMFRTFNMGIGMVIVCADDHATAVKTQIEAAGETCYQIGRVVQGSGQVMIE
jgi:phosphoribosylformylglycinamidine cyclo-ligase